MVVSTEVKSFINKADESDVRAVFELAKRRYGILQTEKAGRFAPGDKVFFDSKRGETVTGVVTKINRKTVKVKADSGVVWTVAPGLLTILS